MLFWRFDHEEMICLISKKDGRGEDWESVE